MRALALVLLLLPPALGAQDEPPPRVDALLKDWGTRWYSLVQQDRKIGVAQLITREKDGLLEIEDAARFVLGRPERALRVTMRCTKDDRMTPRSIKVESKDLQYELEFKDGRASATIGGKKRDVEIPADTVTLHTLARLVCVLPRDAGFERAVKLLDLDTLELSAAKIRCEGEQQVPGKTRFRALKYVLTAAETVELWVNDDLPFAAESPHVAGAVSAKDGAAAMDGYRPDVLTCEVHLATLARRQHDYAAKFGGEDKRLNAATGRKFWLALAETDPALVGKDELHLFVCPTTRTKPAAAVCSYRGPKRDVNLLGPDAVVGCDDPLNHPDGMHVVTLAGAVRWVKRGSEEYNRLLEITTE